MKVITCSDEDYLCKYCEFNPLSCSAEANDVRFGPTHNIVQCKKVKQNVPVRDLEGKVIWWDDLKRLEGLK